LEEYGLHAPFAAKAFTSRLLLHSGKQLFGTDAMVFNESLLYQLATHPTYIHPLEAFKRRRVYANLDKDFLVPLGTAAMLSDHSVQALRKQFKDHHGIVTILPSNYSDILDSSSHLEYSIVRREWLRIEEEQDLHNMRVSLNNLGWERVIVHFPGKLPTAHNKICAMTKHGALIDQLLGYTEGREIMDEAVQWFLDLDKNQFCEATIE
jgi:hypothetical protein